MGVPGYTIDKYFSDKDVTNMDMLESITEEGPEGKALNIFCFKEPEYVMKIMVTWMTRKSWYQFSAFAEGPIFQCRVNLSHSQVPCKFSIGTELGCPCHLN